MTARRRGAGGRGARPDAPQYRMHVVDSLAGHDAILAAA